MGSPPRLLITSVCAITALLLLDAISASTAVIHPKTRHFLCGMTLGTFNEEWALVHHQKWLEHGTQSQTDIVGRINRKPEMSSSLTGGAASSWQRARCSSSRRLHAQSEHASKQASGLRTGPTGADTAFSVEVSAVERWIIGTVAYPEEVSLRPHSPVAAPSRSSDSNESAN